MIKAMSINNSHDKRNYRLVRCQQDNHDFANATNSFSNSMQLDTLDNIKGTIHFRRLATYQNGNFSNTIKDDNKYNGARFDTLFKSFKNEMGNMYLNIGKYDSSIDCYP